MNKKLTSFQKFYADIQFELPKELSDKYAVLSMLGEKENKSIVLIEEKTSRKKYVLKYVYGVRPELRREYVALRQIGVEDVTYTETDREEYLIRPYIEGVSLEQYIENEGVMDCAQAVSLLKKICDRLARMQADGGNMIHRDIKPANIILTPDGGVELIDFECARHFDGSKTKDTMFVGTIATAAPEQYGFAQSDARTDIYAIGKTLCFAMTESYDTMAVKKSRIPLRMKYIIRKCVRFDPERRFQSIAELRDTASGRKRKRGLALTAAVCAAGIAVAVCGMKAYDSQIVTFPSKTMEKAVRTELDKPQGDVLRADLKKIRRLAVVGNEPFSAMQLYACRVEDYVDEVSKADLPRGDIADLSILREMPNLEALYLCRQEIKDISPLKGMDRLRVLALSNNQIRDIAPLKDLNGLTELYIAGNPVESYEPLSGLTNLYELNLDREIVVENKRVAVPSLAPLKGLNLRRLSLANIEPVEGGFSVLGDLDKLEYLFLWNPKEEYLPQIAKAPRLNYVFLCRYRGESVEGLAGAKSLYTLNMHDGFHTIAGVEKIKTVTDLYLSSGIGIDLSLLMEKKNLRLVSIRMMQVEGLDTLTLLPSLEIVKLDRRLKKRFLEEYQSFDFELKDYDWEGE